MKTITIGLIGLFLACFTSACSEDNSPPDEPIDEQIMCLITELPSVDSVLSDLNGQALLDFIANSFQALDARDCFEYLLDDDIAADSMLLAQGVLDQLNAYNETGLTFDEQIEKDVYQWYLMDWIRRNTYRDYFYSLSAYSYIASWHSYLHGWFYGYPFECDTIDGFLKHYLGALIHFPKAMNLILDHIKDQRDKGIVQPHFSFDDIIEELNEFVTTDHTSHPFFINAAKNLEDCPAQQSIIQGRLDQIEDKIKKYVVPKYQELIALLQSLQVSATDHGVGSMPGGLDFYDAVLDSYTTIDTTADEIHQLGLDDVDRIHTQLRKIFDTMGPDYSADKSIPELYAQVAEDSGTVSGDAICQTYNQLLADSKANLSQAFDIWPEAEVSIEFGSDGHYYSTVTNTFFAYVDGPEKLYTMPTLLYHETIPGHHLQTQLTEESDLSDFRISMFSGAYVEGWALYTEQLVWELGWYENNPFGNLGRLQDELLRAARLVIDTGIHTKNWTFQQASDYIAQQVGLTDDFYTIREIGRYFTLPGQATCYKIGMMKMLELRQKVEDQLGQDFDLKEFHRTILLTGEIPLSALETIIDHYLASKRAGNLQVFWSDLSKIRSKVSRLMQASKNIDRQPRQLIPDRLRNKTKSP